MIYTVAGHSISPTPRLGIQSVAAVFGQGTSCALWLSRKGAGAPVDGPVVSRLDVWVRTRYTMYKNLYRSICVLYMWYLHVIMRRTFPTQLQLQVATLLRRPWRSFRTSIASSLMQRSVGSRLQVLWEMMRTRWRHPVITWKRLDRNMKPKFIKPHPWRWCPSSTKFLVLIAETVGGKAMD